MAFRGFELLVAERGLENWHAGKLGVCQQEESNSTPPPYLCGPRRIYPRTNANYLGPHIWPWGRCGRLRVTEPVRDLVLNGLASSGSYKV